MRYIRVSPTESTYFTIKQLRYLYVAFCRLLWNYDTTNVLPYMACWILTLSLQEKRHKGKAARAVNTLDRGIP